jgi:predicted RNase H-like nuclease (RuvC/YqgF family)
MLTILFLREHDISIERIVVTLQATKTRSSSEIERVLGSVQESWNVDDLFAVARGLRREIELAHDTAAAESENHLRSTDRLREERDALKKEAEDARRQVEALERKVDDLNAKIKEDSQALDADNNSLDRIKTLVSLT